MTQSSVKLGILGGTGHQGSGLALRWAQAAYTVAIGSRTLDKAQQAAAELDAKLGKSLIRGMANQAAAAWADIVVLTAPYAAHVAMLEEVKTAVQGKVFIDVTVPLNPQNARRVQMPAAGSAAIEAQQALGPGVQVVAAFQNISAARLHALEREIDCEVLVCGNAQDAKQQVIELVQAAGMQAWDAGPLENSMVVEGLTSVLINLNIKYKVKAAGLRITGIPH